MGLLRDQSTALFLQLAAHLVLTLGVILFAAMGVVDGLKFRRVRFRYGILILGTVRGVPAQIIGGLCVLAELGGVAMLIGYVRLLGRYCGADVGCFLTTPVTGLIAHWAISLGYVMVLFCFILWVRERRTEVSEPSDILSFSLPSVYHYVNGKLAVAHEQPMNRPEVERIMEFVEQHVPFVHLTGAEQIMDGKRLISEKLAAVLLTDKQFRNKGQRIRIAVEAVTAVYVATKQPSQTFHP